MKRRTFLTGLLVAPVVALLGRLMPKSAVQEDLGSLDKVLSRQINDVKLLMAEDDESLRVSHHSYGRWRMMEEV